MLPVGKVLANYEIYMEAFFFVETFKFTESLDSVCISKNFVYRHSRIKIHGDTFSYFDIVASVKDT